MYKKKLSTKLLIKDKRKVTGKSQADFANILGISRTQYGKLENGHHLSLYWLEKIAEILKCSVTDLISEGSIYNFRDKVINEPLAEDIHEALSYVVKKNNDTVNTKQYANAFLKIYQGISYEGVKKVEALQEPNIYDVIRLIKGC